MFTILKIEFASAGQGLWIIRLRRPDGRECQAQFTPDAFSIVRACPMGQFLLHAWFSRASVIPEEEQASPVR